jgi:hypothetical protein
LAWHRQPPKSASRAGQLWQGSGSHAVPQTQVKANDSDQMRAKGASAILAGSTLRMTVAAGQGKTVPSGMMVSWRLPHPFHTWFRCLLVIVGGDVNDRHARMAETGSLHHVIGLPYLFSARQECRPVSQRPAVALGVGELEPVGAQTDGHRRERFDIGDVPAVQDDVNGQDHARCPHSGRYSEFALMNPRASHAVGGLRTGALQAQLHMVDARVGKGAGPVGGEPHPAGDQVDINAERAGARRQRRQVAPQQWLAT